MKNRLSPVHQAAMQFTYASDFYFYFFVGNWVAKMASWAKWTEFKRQRVGPKAMATITFGISNKQLLGPYSHGPVVLLLGP